jgi:hypothetical protein
VNDDATTAVTSCERARGRLHSRQHLMSLTARVPMLACLWRCMAMFECECASLHAVSNEQSTYSCLANCIPRRACSLCHSNPVADHGSSSANACECASTRHVVVCVSGCTPVSFFLSFCFVCSSSPLHGGDVLPSSMHLLISEATCSCQ